eukprot:TRINITY_DN981_c0_g1_i4.p1 TRINITY_DN981_c0_g1~~TRINITY_DN981_c0_g1_i4.p1  ORF type:complete len:177 (-),score=0.66 TRINITY_DN981_c0_g1_i4:35-565(-)
MERPMLTKFIVVVVLAALVPLSSAYGYCDVDLCQQTRGWRCCDKNGQCPSYSTQCHTMKSGWIQDPSVCVPSRCASGCCVQNHCGTTSQCHTGGSSSAFGIIFGAICFGIIIVVIVRLCCAGPSTVYHSGGSYYTAPSYTVPSSSVGIHTHVHTNIGPDYGPVSYTHLTLPTIYSV